MCHVACAGITISISVSIIYMHHSVGCITLVYDSSLQIIKHHRKQKKNQRPNWVFKEIKSDIKSNTTYREKISPRWFLNFWYHEITINRSWSHADMSEKRKKKVKFAWVRRDPPFSQKDIRDLCLCGYLYCCLTHHHIKSETFSVVGDFMSRI